jgi:histone deacetylase 11
LAATIKASIQPKVIYTPRYDIHFWGIERMHPFDGRKYSHAWKLASQSLGQQLTLHTSAPSKPNADLLLSVHSPAYLAQLKSSAYVARALELSILANVPYPLLDARILGPMRLGVAGTVLAARQALSCRLAINLSGGYHHASAEQGEGFCLYADVSVAIAVLRQENLLYPYQKAMIIDLDAHQGNGHERIAIGRRDTYILDMYNHGIYPRDDLARQRIDYDVRLKPQTDGDTYIDTLRHALPAALAKAGAVGIAFYVAGSDIYEHDQLGGLAVSAQHIHQRDQFVLETLAEAGIPTVMVLGGGYSGESHKLIAHAIDFAFKRWGQPQ